MQVIAIFNMVEIMNVVKSVLSNFFVMRNMVCTAKVNVVMGKS